MYSQGSCGTNEQWTLLAPNAAGFGELASNCISGYRVDASGRLVGDSGAATLQWKLVLLGDGSFSVLSAAGGYLAPSGVQSSGTGVTMQVAPFAWWNA